jgi:hypothetical protein
LEMEIFTGKEWLRNWAIRALEKPGLKVWFEITPFRLKSKQDSETRKLAYLVDVIDPQPKMALELKGENVPNYFGFPLKKSHLSFA